MAIDLNRVNPLTEAAIGAAIKVHKALGPGLLESVYLACLVLELRRAGLSVKANVPLPVEYDEVRISLGFRLDIVVDDYVLLDTRSKVRASMASEPRDRSAPTKRRARERVGEFEGRSPSNKTRAQVRQEAREHPQRSSADLFEALRLPGGAPDELQCDRADDRIAAVDQSESCEALRDLRCRTRTTRRNLLPPLLCGEYSSASSRNLRSLCAPFRHFRTPSRGAPTFLLCRTRAGHDQIQIP
jgi:GxxExxY protein